MDSFEEGISFPVNGTLVLEDGITERTANLYFYGSRSPWEQSLRSATARMRRPFLDHIARNTVGILPALLLFFHRANPRPTNGPRRTTKNALRNNTRNSRTITIAGIGRSFVQDCSPRLGEAACSLLALFSSLITLRNRKSSGVFRASLRRFLGRVMRRAEVSSRFQKCVA
jgi:hypothetical protein